MGSTGRVLDNIFVERLWRSLKQEAIYLEEFDDDFKARRVIKKTDDIPQHQTAPLRA